MRKNNLVTKLYALGVSTLAISLMLPNLILADIQTQAAIDRQYELLEQGYDGAVVFDQLYEEFDHVDGPAGTGGIDGLYLDGTPANGDSGSTDTGSKPSSKPKPSTPEAPATPEPPKHTHSWITETVKDSTCLEKGELKYTCLSCNDSFTEETPLVDHDYVLTSQEAATCVAPASFTFTCSVCGITDTQKKDGLADHLYIATNDSFEATCLEAGYLKEVCNVCGDVHEETPEALGHEWSDEYTVDVKAGCTTEGKKSIHCVRCEVVKENSEVTIEPKGHVASEKHQIVEPTFFEDGSETIVCQNCNEVMETNILPATGGSARVLLPVGGVIGVGLIVLVILLKKRK